MKPLTVPVSIPEHEPRLFWPTAEHSPRFWARWRAFIKRWEAEPNTMIVQRLRRHARRCPRGCRIHGAEVSVHPSCWSGLVLFNAWALRWVARAGVSA